MRNFYKTILAILFMLCLTIFGSNAKAQDVLNEGFETGYSSGQALTTPWVVPTSYTWYTGYGSSSYNREPHTGDYYAYLGYNKTSWMFHEVSLTVGETYNFSMWAQEDQISGADITVKIGAAAEAISMTDEIVAKTTIGNSWIELTGTYTPASTGTYYIGILGEVGGTPWYLTIDDIKLSLPLADDLEVESVLVSPGSITEDDEVTFTAAIGNLGTNAQTSTLVTFKVDGSSIGTQTIASIASGATENASITWTATKGNHTVTVELPSDDFTDNNTSSQNFLAIPLSYQVEGFEGSSFPSTNWELTEASIWTQTTTAGEYYEGSKAARIYKYGLYSDAQLITPKLVLNSESFISFYAKSADPYNKIQIQYSTDKSTWTDIGSENILTAGYALYTVDLSSLSGNYYLSFTCNPTTTYSWYSNYLYLDNIIIPELYVSSDPEIAISPSSYNFGSISTGATANATITLSNPGGADLTVSGVSIASPFSATWSGTIAAGGTQDITVSVSSASAGSFTETLTVTSNAASGTNTIDISAEVVAPLTYPLTEGFNGSNPSYWDLGSWYLVSSGVYEGTHAITTYSSSDAMSTPWIDLTGTTPRMVLYWKNASLKKMQIEITEDASVYTELFNAAPVTADWEELVIDLSAYVNKTVQIRFTSDPAQSFSSTYIDDLKIEETPTLPVYEFNKTEFAYGTILLGESVTLSASVTNGGVSTVDIDTIYISGIHKAEFSLSALTFPQNIDNASSLDFDLTFTPVTEGGKTATLTIKENDGTLHNYDVTATGFDAEIKTLPFTENFDALTAPALPAGWDKIINSSSSSAVVQTYNSATYANSGTNSVRIYGAYSTGSELALILPITSLDIAITELSFSAYGGSDYQLQVGYMTDKTDLATFTEIKLLDITSGNNDYSINFSDVVLSGDYYLAFQLPNPNHSIYIDDINWAADETAPVVSFDPANTHTGVNPFRNIEIAFDEKIYKNGGDELVNADLTAILSLKETNASGADVLFSAIIENNKIIITPNARLAFATDYYVGLSADAVQDVAGNLNVLSEATFTTMIEPIIMTVPFTESFEGVDFVPTNWTENRTKWSKYEGTEITYPDGAAAAYYYGSGFESQDSAEMVSPIINISSLTDPNLLFDYADTNATFGVFVSYDLGYSYEQILSENTDDGWNNANMKLTAGKEYAMLKFKGHNGNWTGSSTKIYVDNISLDETPEDSIFTISHTSHNFGAAQLTNNSNIEVKCWNSGGGYIRIQDVRLEGTDVADFELSTLSLPVDLTNDTLKIDLTFAPLTEGSKSVTLIIEENGVDHEVSLTGIGFDAEIKTLPYTENFDATTVGEMPQGWSSIINTTSSSAYVEVSDYTFANSAPNELRIYGGKAEGTVMAVLPFTNMDLTDAKLKFIGRGSIGCSVIIGTLTDNTDEGTFTPIDTIDITEGVNKAFEIDLSGITETGTYYIGLKHGNPNSFFLLYFDDLRITNNKTPLFTSVPETDNHAGDLYAYTIAATDPDGDALSFSHTYKPDWLTLTDNGDGTALLSGTSTETGYNSVTIVVSDSEDQTEQSFTLTVSNVAPSFTTAPLTTAIVTEPYFYQVSATDNDGDVLTFVGETLPAWLTFTENVDGTANLEGTPGTVGDFNVELSVTDGFDIKSQLFTIVVADTNAKPVFISTPVIEITEGQLYTYDIAAKDTNEDPLTIFAVTKPDWLTLTDNNDGTALISGTAGTDGNYDIKLSVTDGEDTTHQEFTLTVLDNQIAPEFTSLPITKVTSGEVYSYSVQAVDTNNEALTLYTEIKPDWLTFTDNGDGTALLTGNAVDVGKYDVSLAVTDGIDTTHQIFEIEISALPNNEPVFDSLPVLTGMEDELYVYNIYAHDDDATDVLIFTATVKPDWLTLTKTSDTTALLTGTPNTSGIFDVTITLSDGAVFISQTFQINVAEKPNTPPVFASLPVTSIFENETYLYNIVTNDIDEDDVLTITAPTIPTWLTLTDNGNGTGTLTGSTETAGDYNVVLNVNDGVANVQQAFTITVKEVPNNAPVFTSTPNENGIVGQEYYYSFEAKDDDVNDTIIFGFTNIPTWLTLNKSTETGLLAGIPTQAGEFEISIFATDLKDTTYQIWTVTIIDITHPPVFETTPVTVGNVDSLYIYRMNVTDVDGDDVTYSGDTLPDWMSIAEYTDGSAAIYGTPMQEGTYRVSVSATDGEYVISQAFDIFVTKINTAPEFTSEPILSGQVNIEYVYNIVVADVDNDNVTIESEGLPTWLTLTDNGDGTAELKGATDVSDIYSIKLLASDGELTTEQSYNLDIKLTNINDNLESSVNIYPNPANVKLVVETTMPASIKLINITGEVVWQADTDDAKTTINIQDFASGYYFVKVEMNNKILTKKVIVE